VPNDQTPIARPPDPRRAELARRQAHLVRALQGDAPLPEGFDAEQVGRAADSLVRKRARSVQKTWPATARALGDRFDQHFTAYAAENLLPPNLDTDGLHFAQWLRSRGLLPDEAKLELAAWRVLHGFPVRLLFLRNARILMMVYRNAGAARVLRLGGDGT
jgi:hypothetical protein